VATQKMSDLVRSPQKVRPKPQVRRYKPVSTAPSRSRKSLAAMTVSRTGDTPIKGFGTRNSPIEIDSETEGRPRAGPSRTPRAELSMQIHFGVGRGSNA